MKKKRKAFSVYALASGEFGEKLHNTDCYQGEHWGRIITGGSRGGPGSPSPNLFLSKLKKNVSRATENKFLLCQVKL